MDDINQKAIEEIAPYSGEHAIPGIRFRPVGKTLGIGGFGMNVIEMDPGVSAYPAHDHGDDGHEEAYLVLRGTAYLVTDSGERTVREGEIVAVPGRVPRKFVTRDSSATLVALGGTPGQPYKPTMGRPAKL
jgi:uncharacterized cupin superfamily protein